MKIKTISPPRIIKIKKVKEETRLKECAHINLEDNELITLTTDSGTEYDITRKSWGYYATPSMNGRLQQFGLRSVLVKNSFNQFFIMLVEKGKETEFGKYLEKEDHKIITWLDNNEVLRQAVEKIKSKHQKEA
jgi:hypothetical protein